MSTRQIRRVSQFVSTQIWALREATLDVIVEVLRMRSVGIALSKEEVQARIGAASTPSVRQQGSVAILPLCGVISPKINAMTEISGGTSLDRWMAQFRQTRDDAGVGAIVIDADSPGGSVFAVPEAADEIYRSRSAKPIVAVVNPECGSAALWIAAACGEVVCTPSGSVGSLGVFCCHEDWSKANETIGVKPTYISAGPYKVEGNPNNPLSDDTLAFLQSQVDAVYETFLKSVARGRGVTPAKARSDFGGGRMMLAKDALAAGLIDRIDTLDNVVARMVGGRKTTSLRATATTQSLLAEAGSVAIEDGGDNDPATDHTVLIDDAHVHHGTALLDAFAASASKRKAEDPIEPEDGECPDGYELGEDGLCHLMVPDEEPEDDSAQAEADAVAIAAVLGAE